MRTSYLPAKVEPICDAPILMASRKADTHALAFGVLNTVDTHPTRALGMAAAIYGAGIMYGPWWMRTSIRVQMLRLRCTRTQAYVNAIWSLATKKPEIATEMVNDMLASLVHHITSGEDREEPFSVGGLSQREMQALCNIVAVTKRHETPVVETYHKAMHNQLFGAVL